MRWHKPSLKAIQSFWGQRARSEVVPGAVIDTVRHAMLQATPHLASGEPQARLFFRIQRATSLQALWYLRSDLLSAIASQYGETLARERIATTSLLFEGLIPEAREAASPGLQRKRTGPGK